MANNALAPNIDNVLSDYVYAGRKIREQRNKNMLNPQVSLSDRLESLSYAAGEGFADQLRGLQQLITHPVQSAQDIYSGVKYAVQNPREAAQAAVEGLKGAVQSPESATRFIAQNFSPAELATGLGKLGTMREIVVHHGTPHRFEPTEANPLGEFDASKIGTGEGGQVYGHGLYLAESPEVADYYAANLTNTLLPPLPIMFTHEGSHFTKEAGAYLKDGKEIPKTEYGTAYKSAVETFENKPKGHRYKADLPDEMVDRMLDWDKSLSEQPKAVQKAWQEISEEFGVPTNENEMIGPVAMRAMLEPEFQKRGIPGIKYLDAGSRGQAGTGTRNFVVFPGEEKKVKILERK
jgi:hypothetical protein